MVWRLENSERGFQDYMDKVAFTCGIYDLCHIGHLILFRKMRKMGYKTVAVIHDDISCFAIKDKIPIQSLNHRIRNLEITGLVDEIVVTHSTEPVNEFLRVIEKYGADNLIFVRGDDNLNFPARSVVDRADIPIKFVEYTKGVSSTKLREELCS